MSSGYYAYSSYAPIVDLLEVFNVLNSSVELIFQSTFFRLNRFMNGIRFRCLHTPMALASRGGSDLPACGPPASFSIHLASSAVTPAVSIHKSRGDNVVRMWVKLKR